MINNKYDMKVYMFIFYSSRKIFSKELHHLRLICMEVWEFILLYTDVNI